ncbi:FAD-dependent oxidoreductase [Heliobacterium chlorum]|uniref:FAD-dependent oxidoreductase n=1 Tax=Heliobacterium chlorum TaxID=2698 RepID=A0ABR7T4A3_HELCL|nr:FAD-dependent oxidoreductase [Heliobacterium chlorum]MBC9785600.1 FAD-dependent oxidoreductase [Heliobacterium chlorum]
MTVQEPTQQQLNQERWRDVPLEFEAIVVGAGPAGLAAAYTLAKGGVKTLLIERGDFPGSKNVMGGILYSYPTHQVISDFWKEAPLERPIVEQRAWLLAEESVVTIGFKDPGFYEEPYNNFSVFRSRFDRWMANKTVEAGATLITETVVTDFLFEERADRRKVAGVVTNRDHGEIRAQVVLICEGANSILTQRLGLQEDLSPGDLAVGVKEVIALPKGAIEDRFNVEKGQGVTIELIGESTQGMFGMGWIYTNKDTLSIGVGVMINQLSRSGMNPNTVLEKMKQHPAVRPLLTGGETKEYLAKIIPEGGYHQVPKLYDHGVLICGDAAMLVNGVHREGSNLAMTSGKLAAETVIEAKKKGDFSSVTLKAYHDRLQDSFVLKDLKKYENASALFQSNPHFFTLYPKLARYSARELFTVDNVSKKDKQKKIWHEVTSRRGIWNIAGDMYRLWRTLG